MIHLTDLITTKCKISPDLVILFVGLGREVSCTEFGMYQLFRFNA